MLPELRFWGSHHLWEHPACGSGGARGTPDFRALSAQSAGGPRRETLFHLKEVTQTPGTPDEERNWGSGRKSPPQAEAPGQREARSRPEGEAPTGLKQ